MRKPLVLLCGLAAAATLLAGCSGGGGGHALTAAQPKTVNQLLTAFSHSDKNTAHFTMDVTTPKGTLESGTGQYRGGNDFGMTMNMHLNARAIGSATGMSIPEGAGDMTIKMVMVDKAIYMSVPVMQKVTGGKPWMKIDASGHDMMSQMFGTMLTKAKSQSDPRVMFDKLKGASTITKTATEQLNGQQVTHYWLTVDTAKSLGNITDPQLKAMVKKQLAKLPKTFPMQLWVTKDGLPLKMRSQSTQPDIGKATVTLTYTDWGKPVTITAPPANEVDRLTLPTGH